MFTLGRLLDASGGRVILGRPERGMIFAGGAFDSRIAGPGTLFFALRDRRDGHDFVADALARGCLGAVVERMPAGVADDALLIQVADVPGALRALAEAQRVAHPVPAVGITGSVGKTTAKQAAAAALAPRHRVLAPTASYNNEIGVPLTLLLLEPEHTAAVLELGFYVPGEIADLCRLVRPAIGVITAIPDRPAHFERTPSVERIARGKAELIEALPAEGTALLNADDPRVRGLAPLTRARVVLFGEAADAEVRATEIEAGGLDGVSFTVTHARRSARVRLPLPGRHLVPAALAAIGAAVALEVPLAEAAAGLEALEPPPHRMAVRRARGLVVIDDSYNASPAAVHAALALLRAQAGRRIAVLGEMRELGALAPEAHADVGRDAATAAEIVVGVGAMAAGMVEAARAAGRAETHSVPDGSEALRLLEDLVRPGDVVLVKGSRALELDRLADALVGAGA